MGGGSFFFAGGGAGGHVYPAIAIAEILVRLEPDAHIHFLCSTRSIDRRVLSQTDYEMTELPATGLSFRPDGLLRFASSFLRSHSIAKEILSGCGDAVVVGIGGFVAAPACLAARRLKVPVVLVNVDIIPGRANRFTARFADRIFLQFEDSVRYLGRTKAAVSVVGCPLRRGFSRPQPAKAIEQLGLDKDKKILLVTGASSGSESINRAVCSLLEKLGPFADSWQIVHLTGIANFESVRQMYAGAAIGHKVLDYYDYMWDLLSAADLAVGRSGAVSIAEYAAAGVPSICIPYPHHRDRHQYFNAEKLVEAGAAVIVDDLPNRKDRAGWLWEELERLMKDDQRRGLMKENCRRVAAKDAAEKIAARLLQLCPGP
jgi:UDP-N-acetylglucosamine--N-acetylmuramyl-(pentapeptide) pyrophosphoryl-undecaprenol N-acetylglucosamine transferase